MNIRKATKEDYKSIADIYNIYIEEGNSTMERNLHSENSIQNWVTNFNDKETIEVYEENKEVLGWVILKRYSDRLGYKFAAETSIYLHPKSIGKNIGFLLKNHILKVANKNLYKHLTAKIFAHNTRSLEFYKKFGYTVVGKQNKIGFINDKWIDIIILEKNI